MSEWISVKDKVPEIGQNVIAIGSWWGETYGYDGNDKYIGIGVWNDNHVRIDSDGYETCIRDVTYWMPSPNLPEPPNE